MAVTQDQLDALVEAYNTGADYLTYEGKTIKYRSKAEMEAQIAKNAAALGVRNPLAPNPVTTNRIGLATFSRG